MRYVISDSHSDFMDQSPAKGSIRVNVSMRIKPLGCGTPVSVFQIVILGRQFLNQSGKICDQIWIRTENILGEALTILLSKSIHLINEEREGEG